MPFGAPQHVVSIIRFSHHVGCRLVHPNTWYQLFGSPIMLDAVWCTPTRGINYSVLPSCWMPFGAPQHVVSTIRSPIMLDAVWCTPTRGINYSVSHHVGCRLVHPNTWYQLFGLPSCWMPFGAPQHVVSIIRSPIMLDAVWCTPTRGINYSVSHHVGCRLVHPNTWYQLFGLPSCWMPFGAPQHVVSIKCHTPSRRMPIGASRQVGHFFNAIRHHDGCRLVHPAKWDIGIISGCLRDGCRLVHPVRRFILHNIQFTFMTDSV